MDGFVINLKQHHQIAGLNLPDICHALGTFCGVAASRREPFTGIILDSVEVSVAVPPTTAALEH
jgi:hypothetical protein